MKRATIICEESKPGKKRPGRCVARPVWLVAGFLIAAALATGCAKNDFKFGGSESSGDPFELVGLLDQAVFHTISCGTDIYLSEVPGFSLDGSNSEFASTQKIFNDASGDTTAGAGTDLQGFYMGYSSTSGGSLVLFYPMDTTPANNYAARLSSGGLNITVSVDGAGNPSLNASKYPDNGCQNRTDLASKSATGLEAVVPLSCIQSSTVGRISFNAAARGELKTHPISDHTATADSIDLSSKPCMVWEF